jgi:uncharacterized membrane protein
MTRDDPARQLRAALLWACNPLLLQVLVAGGHVDSQAVVFGVAALAVGAASVPRAAAAGALVGLGFAVKVTAALVGLGLAFALVFTLRREPGARRRLMGLLAALAAGFAATAGAAVAIGGPAMLRQSSRASDMVSIGSPWRVIRTLIQFLVKGTAATDIVKYGALALAVVLAVLLIRALPEIRTRGPGAAASMAFALALAWLFAWPYVLPWYDALAWALLPLALAGPALADQLCFLLLARTAALGFGYLPARTAGVTMPPGLTWLQPVIRHGITPVVLAMTTVWLVVLLVRSGRARGSGPQLSGAARTTASRAG